MNDQKPNPTVRQHPDIFTPDEALAYLHLESVRSLEILENDFGLQGFKGVGKSRMYHRDDLDAAVLRWFGRTPSKKGLRIAN